MTGQITGPKTQAQTLEHLASSAHVLPRSELELATRTIDERPLYQPLHHGSLIRVLEIVPGSSDGPVSCHFHLVDLQAWPLKQFEALSYVWGTSSFEGINKMGKESIQCNWNEFLIPPNLKHAIKHTRSGSAPVFLWADAISRLILNKVPQKLSSLKYYTMYLSSAQ